MGLPRVTEARAAGAATRPRASATLAVALICAAAGCGGGTEAAGPAPTETTNAQRPVDLDPGERRVVKPGRDRRPEKRDLRAAATKPPIVSRPIEFGARRKRQMADYSERHHGEPEWALTRPRVIVQHWTFSNSFESAYNTFAANMPDVEQHELPGVCTHFIVDRDGTIYQLVKTTIRCRHTVGLDYTAVGIEHVGTTDAQVLDDTDQLAASLRLTNWLRCRHGIKVRNVIGHAESLSSPYHREDVASLRSQTHSDMQPKAMAQYRSALATKRC